MNMEKIKSLVPDSKMFESGDKCKFRVSIVSGSGLGLVATRSIQQSELLFEEEPLVLIEAFLKHQDIPWTDKCDYLKKKVNKLSPGKRKQYFDLHDCKKSESKANMSIIRET